jgi:thiol-disulfide isomerase/thioredoxin/DNA-binding beta-propeller fold protein YncE
MLGLAPAPELGRTGVRWFNVARPLSLGDLRGRLVILDFWTPCCVNCLHVLPSLRRLEEAFADSIAVVGVHSPKYPAEQDEASLLNALSRYDIRHPIAHDPHLQLWRDYGISAWPTLVFIDPRGHILGDLPGEPAGDKLIAGVGEMIRHWRAAGLIRPSLLELQPPPRVGARFRLPGKIKPMHRQGKPKLWAIADSGHHQIVLCDDAGREVRRYGCGDPGFLDLTGEDSAFNSPQGLACDAGSIYVADTGNHAIRRIALATGAVSTLAGTGERGPVLRGRLAGRDTPLASVWDVECFGGKLFFANAGSHQLGELDLATGEVAPLAGTGTEDLVDGDALQANLAQPTGLALDQETGSVYFVDSETSSVRALRAGSCGRVETLVGAGLFECGRRNGDFATARLQHCRGLAWWQDRLVVADSYNGVLRVLDLRARQVSELAGEDCRWTNGTRLGGGEPAGVAADGGERLLVADTNHHRLIEVIVDGTPRANVWAA